MNNNDMEFIQEAAFEFFQNPVLVDTLFFTKARICRTCRTTYTLSSLLREGNLLKCPAHNGHFDVFTQTWSCCQLTERHVNVRCGCTTVLHDVNQLQLEAVRTGCRYVISKQKHYDIGYTYLHIPINVWLSIMYASYRGIFKNFLENIKSHVELPCEVKTFDSTESMQKFMSPAKKKRKRSDSFKFDSVKKRKQDGGQSIKLVSDCEYETEIYDMAEEKNTVFIGKLEDVKEKKESNLFLKKYNKMIFVYECCT